MAAYWRCFRFPDPKADEGIWHVGRLPRDLHDATAGDR
jgi:hypothetical protein